MDNVPALMLRDGSAPYDGLSAEAWASAWALMSSIRWEPRSSIVRRVSRRTSLVEHVVVALIKDGVRQGLAEQTMCATPNGEEWAWVRRAYVGGTPKIHLDVLDTLEPADVTQHSGPGVAPEDGAEMIAVGTVYDARTGQPSMARMAVERSGELARMINDGVTRVISLALDTDVPPGLTGYARAMIESEATLRAMGRRIGNGA